MVITVKQASIFRPEVPAIKNAGISAVRIDDDVIVGKEGCTLLSGDAPRKWQEIEKTAAEKSFFNSADLKGIK